MMERSENNRDMSLEDRILRTGLNNPRRDEPNT